MSKIVVVGSHFELVYLATKLSEKHEVTLIDLHSELGGSCYDSQFPHYGINATDYVPEDLSVLFQPVDIVRAFDNLVNTLSLPVTDWGLRSLSQEYIPLDNRPEFEASGLSTFEILSRRLGTTYVENVISPFIESIYDTSIAHVSPRHAFQLISKYFEYSREQYLPTGGYSSIANILLGDSSVTYQVELPSLDILEKEYDLILWGDSPYPIYEKYYFDLCAPVIRSMYPEINSSCTPCDNSTPIDPIDLYKEEINLSECLKYKSIASVDVDKNAPMIGVVLLNTSEAFEIANIDVLSLGSDAGLKGYTAVDEGIPLIPVSAGFDSLLDVKFPDKYRFVNEISKYSIPNISKDLRAADSEVEYVNNLFSTK